MNELDENIQASIFIPTKNPGPEFEDILKGIFAQKKVKFEVVIVDSGSNQRILNMISKYPIKLYCIKPEEFGHGKTRNLALKYTEGEYIVFMTQDAVPANDLWLYNLFGGFTDEKVAGVFSRQIPRADARATEVFFYQHHFSGQRIIRPKQGRENFLDKVFFSNVSSCVRRDIFEKYSFNESLIMSEDQQWSHDVLRAGYQTVYEPSSSVVHSHHYSLQQTAKRYFDSSFSLRQIFGADFKILTKASAVYATGEFRYALKQNPGQIFYLFLFNLARTAGTFLGWHGERLPDWLKRKVSMHSYYWKKT